MIKILNKIFNRDPIEENFNLTKNEKIVRFWAGQLDRGNKQISAALTNKQRLLIKIEEEKNKLIIFNSENRPKIMDTGQEIQKEGQDKEKIIEITTKDGDSFAIIIHQKGIPDLIAWSKGAEIKE